ncbi:MAG TPA: RnfH family protein [Rhodanobacteraceae bacterium]|nr:RnfH family protein [Rhodanobacteraceae bacterium]
MPDAALVRVSVVLAGPGRVFSAALALPAGATVADAIERAGVRIAHPDVDLRDGRIGIFSRKVGLATPLRDGDRVEIYRPLRIDPKEARRRRAKGA